MKVWKAAILCRSGVEIIIHVFIQNVKQSIQKEINNMNHSIITEIDLGIVKSFTLIVVATKLVIPIIIFVYLPRLFLNHFSSLKFTS